MTANREDYLKMIYELGGYENQVSNKKIAEGLQISAASVSEMLQKLYREGDIEYTPYKGIQLTEHGANKASSLLRKHRLWEVFLVQQLQFSWSDVDEVAELLEHVTSSELAERLERYLQYPSVCPHGAPIPYQGSHVHDKDLKELRTLRIGESAVIQRVVDEKELLDYLNHLQLTVGDQVTVVSIEPYEGPIILQAKGKEFQISQKAAANIYVGEQQETLV